MLGTAAGRVDDIHAPRTASDLPTLPHALGFALSVRVCFAFHVVIVVGFAAVADEVGRAHQWRRTSSDLLDLRDVIGEGCGVDEDALVEPKMPGQLACNLQKGQFLDMVSPWLL